MSTDIFDKLKLQLMMIDPVAFVEKYLMLDNKPFKLQGNGYKPFADIYRYIGVKALEPDSKPVILVKGRQVGGTTMACALEMYFMGSGLFGTGDRPPIRVIHTFPILELAAGYSKSKLNSMINSSIPAANTTPTKNGKIKSHMQNLLDQTSATNDSLSFKQFVGGNHIWIESTGLDADRIMGKQLCLETEIPTPYGFVKLKDLKEQDELFDETGNICKVTKLHPINISPESYKITFDDGSVVDACAEHLWLTYTKSNRSKKTKPTIKTTKEILNSLTVCGEKNHSIPLTQPVKYKKTELPLDPYLFGLWLGDGTVNGTIESADPEIFKNFKHHVVNSSINKKPNKFGKISKSKTYRIENLTSKLVKLNQFKYNDLNSYNKHIPESYMTASYEDRLSLVQGLLDTDGHCDKNGNIEFTQVRENLARQFHELVFSLGIKATISQQKSWFNNVQHKDRFRVRFSTHLPVFRLERKLSRIKANKKQLPKSYHRFISSVEKIPSKPMRCITVDSESHLYLITRSYIPTHNTADVMFFDECFPAEQLVSTIDGPVSFGTLFKDFSSGEILPYVKSFNEKLNTFEYKEITHVWSKGKEEVVEATICSNKIQCTARHPFYTRIGWQPLCDITIGAEIKVGNNWHPLENIKQLNAVKNVFDIEVKDNNNFVLCFNEFVEGPVAHNCQKTTSHAIGNALKILTAAKYGKPTKGVQVFFGTPRRKGTDYHKMWQSSSQQYYHLGCLSCKKHFPLYTPGSDEWEKIWLHGHIVKCTHCGHEQDKRLAAEDGKWIAMRDENDPNCKMIGFHINQLYMPKFTKESIMEEKPGIHPINTDRTYQNEVLGEFFQGDSSPITVEEISELCADKGRKFSARIEAGEENMVFVGIDYGAKSDAEQLSNPENNTAGRSYSTAVVLLAKGGGLLSVEFATKFRKNDPESKKGIIDQIMRQYNVKLAVGDIGFSNDFSYTLAQTYGDRYLVSRASPKVNNHVKYNTSIVPKEIGFERDFYIGELFEQMKKGLIRFPYGDYEKVAWLIEHCASMEIKPSLSRAGEPSLHYVKGGTPNDGFMALLNAYLAYKFYATNGFSTHNPLLMNNIAEKKQPLAIVGYINKRF